MRDGTLAGLDSFNIVVFWREAAFRSRQNSTGLPKPWCDVHDHRMPELPDIVAYITALESRIVGQQLIRVRVASTFLLRSAQPPIREVEGRVVRELRRIGKRIAFGMENDLWLVLHLMIAGRLHWRPPQSSLAGRNNLAAFDFPNGSLILTEAGAKRRASLHLLSGEENLFSTEAGTGFPDKVTAFHKGMAVHDRYGQPCPRCGEKVLRIRYADNETNYCARCQTAGMVLADRSLSRLFGFAHLANQNAGSERRCAHRIKLRAFCAPQA
jgi:formamidopyrimidine-DNA glycosylase